MVSVSSKYSSG